VVTTTTAGGFKSLATVVLLNKTVRIELPHGHVDSLLGQEPYGTALNRMVLRADTLIVGLNMVALAAKWKEPPRDALDRLSHLRWRQDGAS
jgi:hypothetical protein